jgi:hypothetical protein
MTTSPSTIEPAAPATDATVDALEQAWRLPAVEPTRPATLRSRRAAAVVHATRAGYAPLELLTIVMFAALLGGLATLVAAQLVG